MRSFKLYWDLHRWTGICLVVLLAGSAVTGSLLLFKKRVDWIQPPTLNGEPGQPGDFIPMSEVYERVLALGHPDFTGPEDIDRIDVRPARRVYKVRSKHGHAEVQIDAVNGAVLGTALRRSDLIEDLHDGSFFGDWVHRWVMPIVPAGLLFLGGSGLWLWIEPKLRRRRRVARRRYGLADNEGKAP